MVRAPLTGCDAHFLALERMMGRSGQGRAVGLTVLKLEGAFDRAALETAARRFSQSHPLLHGSVREGFFKAPEWIAEPPFADDAVPVLEHRGVPLDSLCRELLNTEPLRAFEFHILREGGDCRIVARWLHALFDGVGAGLAFQEIAKLAANPPTESSIKTSWGIPEAQRWPLLEEWRLARKFVEWREGLEPLDYSAFSEQSAGKSPVRFRTIHFEAAETSRIHDRAGHLTGGIFFMPFFLAAAARAHAAVLNARGIPPRSLLCPLPAQMRKNAAEHPIFQNQICVLFFKIPGVSLRDLADSARAVHAQFDRALRGGFDAASGAMLSLLRRLPRRLHTAFLLAESRGRLASFHHSHTGEFLPRVTEFCGARLVDGWHVPSVPQPPGSGIFFSECRGRLSATISWRENSASEGEIDTMEKSLRADLLGENP